MHSPQRGNAAGKGSYNRNVSPQRLRVFHSASHSQTRSATHNSFTFQGDLSSKNRKHRVGKRVLEQDNCRIQSRRQAGRWGSKQCRAGGLVP
jgi:hypothetical protein